METQVPQTITVPGVKNPQESAHHGEMITAVESTAEAPGSEWSDHAIRLPETELYTW